MDWQSELARELPGRVLADDVAREAMATDFGRIVARRPEVVVRPASTADVQHVVKFALRHSLRLATRGAGHSQSGQSLSSQIVLDMTSLGEVNEVSEDAVSVQAGVKWRALVEHLVPRCVFPPVLTNNLDVTVGGTLSMGGLGVASWRYGTQADNCVELEVVTGEGESIRCSAGQNRELFDVVRCGAGQFGVITEAVLKVRPHAPRYRSFYLLYDDLTALLDDLKAVMSEGRFDYLEAWCAPCPQGFKNVAGQRQSFAQWFFPLHATLEVKPGAPRSDAGRELAGLKFYKRVHTEEGEIVEFFTRLDQLFALWKRGGFWDYAHPWMECLLPWQTTGMYLNQVLANLPAQALVGGHILLWPALGAASRAPLFMRPQGEFVMGLGILAAVPGAFVNEALARLGMASQGAILVGGKRYLSGWINFDHAAWKAHYGGRWTDIMSAKQRFDPQGILNPGFIKYE